MAEFVEKNIEETIPEVEEMERIGLLSSKEVKKLIQTRRDFHYRLVRKSKNKADYINYVNYERKVIDLVKIRRKQIGIREKSKQIETAICKRVMKMLRYLTRVWPSHLDTWKLRTSFAQHIGWKDEIGFAFAEQIRYHGNRENVWVAWAKWEIEERENFDKARKILLSTAQLYHPKSHFIKRELFRLELLYVESLMNKMKNGNNTGLEEIIQKILILHQAFSLFLYISCISLPSLILIKSCHILCFRDVCVKFPNTAGVWKLKAQKWGFGLTLVECEGHENDVTTGRNKEVADRKVNKENMDSYEKEEEGIAVDTEKEEEGSRNWGVPFFRDHLDSREGLAGPTPFGKIRLECIILAFDEATRVIGGSFLNTYIEELLPLLYQCWGAADMTDLIFKKLISFSETHTRCLSPLSFFVLCQVMCEMSLPINDIQSVLEEAIKCHPEVAHLRLKFVQLIIRKLSNKQMMEDYFLKDVIDPIDTTQEIDVILYLSNVLEGKQLDVETRFVLEKIEILHKYVIFFLPFRHQATDELKLEVEDSVQTERENHITKILKSCAVLKPEFMQETHVSPYFIGKKKAKEQCRREREKTKGPGWFNMKAPELTEEVKRDLEVLQMRSVLDPKRHFKSTDMKVLPKYFHLGRVVDNPIEFYSSRIPKKERKRTLAEEIIHDEEALRYQKRKYTEIIAAKHKKLLRHQEQHKKTDKKAHKKADKSKSK
nr:LOW QUALITY PROTEIN: uncharacterized protein LOC128692194 [Cherax quadricarinatus]